MYVLIISLAKSSGIIIIIIIIIIISPIISPNDGFRSWQD